MIFWLVYLALYAVGAMVVGAVIALYLLFQVVVWATALAVVLVQSIVEHEQRTLPPRPRVRSIPQARWSDRR